MVQFDDQAGEAPPRIEYLRVQNYRALRDLEFKKLTPLTVFLGPNGSGKSTIFDVFAFLSECFSVGLRKAWDRRGRFKELRSRGVDGPISIQVKYREPKLPVVTYSLDINEDSKGPFVQKESLRWTRGGGSGRPFDFLSFSEGEGFAIPGESPEETDSDRVNETLASRELLAVNTLGQFTKHPRASALRRFITDWYLSYLTADNTRGVPEAGPQERLSATGDNLPNVIQYLKESHQERLTKVLSVLSQRVPRLEKVDAEIMTDGRLLLQIKDAPFEKPVMAKFASDGTLKMLAYLVVLYDPHPPQLVGIEEPENQLHPRLLPELAEECRVASEKAQLMITTHSPFFVNGLKPAETWIMYRDESGYTKAQQASTINGVRQFVDEGSQLGFLWMQGHFGVGDPIAKESGSSQTTSRVPRRTRRSKSQRGRG